ncbi:hypothetical protein BJ742DRAFT_820528 [Cladochytrium replicatum]|nr:hypothetical protein BJ742DRAFT_820528 [Cladochytrium replicatum]
MSALAIWLGIQISSGRSTTPKITVFDSSTKHPSKLSLCTCLDRRERTNTPVITTSPFIFGFFRLWIHNLTFLGI